MDTNEKVWLDIKERIKNSGVISEVQYITWIECISSVEFKGSVMYIFVPNSVAKNSIEERYIDLISTATYKTSKKDYVIKVLLEGSPIIPEAEVYRQMRNPVVKDDETRLNPKYTFENFVVGNSNRFAHAYALSVAESPGGRYNPLYLYGKSGLGKTHLCHAICHFLISTREHIKILYVSAEKYTNDFIASLQNKTTDVFREKYRSCDILIIDDIQFIAGKESTIEEFFHTFNALYESNKQIVLTSDKPPKEINNIDERLITRFGCGLTIDITPPDFETRLAILKNKAEDMGVSFDDEVYIYIADIIKSNIRELEGALNKLAAYRDINPGVAINETTCADILKETFSDSDINYSYDDIINAVCKYFHISKDELMGKSKRKEVAIPRQYCFYLCEKYVKKATTVSIGKEFEKNHATVIYGINKIKDEIKNKNEKTISLIEDIKALMIN